MQRGVILILDAVLPEVRAYLDAGGRVELPAAELASARLVLLTLVMAALAILGAASLRAFRRRRLLQAEERRRLGAFLASRGITAQEASLLEDLIGASEEPAARVVKLVLSFDRGVDRHLARSGDLPTEEKVLLLRRLKTIRGKLELDRVAPGVPLLSSREMAPGQELVLRSGSQPRGRVHAGILLDYDDTGLLVEVADPAPAEPEGPDPTGTAAEATGPPMTQGGDAQLELDVCFLRRGDGGYRFRARLLGSWPGSDPGRSIWRLAHPRKLHREQRRDYLRVPVDEEVRFTRLGSGAGGHPPATAAPGGLEKLPLEHRGVLVDLSGGGFRLAAEGLVLEPDDVILLRLPFLEPPFDRELLVARGVRFYRERGEVGFAFEETAQGTAAAVVRHVEATHRRMRCMA